MEYDGSAGSVVNGVLASLPLQPYWMKLSLYVLPLVRWQIQGRQSSLVLARGKHIFPLGFKNPIAVVTHPQLRKYREFVENSCLKKHDSTLLIATVFWNSRYRT